MEELDVTICTYNLSVSFLLQPNIDLLMCQTTVISRGTECTEMHFCRITLKNSLKRLIYIKLLVDLAVRDATT